MKVVTITRQSSPKASSRGKQRRAEIWPEDVAEVWKPLRQILAAATIGKCSRRKRARSLL